jgi:small multidrug resistance pump
MKWLILFLGVAFNASASVLVKLATLPPRHLPSLLAPAAAMRNWPFWLGLGMYAGAFLMYTAALARFPLNVAHPVLTAGAIATVALMSRFMFREPFSGATLAGIAMVIAGVLLITSRAG